MYLKVLSGNFRSSEYPIENDEVTLISASGTKEIYNLIEDVDHLKKEKTLTHEIRAELTFYDGRKLRVLLPHDYYKKISQKSYDLFKFGKATSDLINSLISIVFYSIGILVLLMSIAAFEDALISGF